MVFFLPSIPIWQYILSLVLIVSSIGVITIRKPVHASLSFLLTILTLAVTYLQLSAEFIAVMQILVYAGAILVIFMYIIVLFQDAYLKIPKTKPQSSFILLSVSILVFVSAILLASTKLLLHFSQPKNSLPEGFGTVQSIGLSLYSEFFFPFEAVILLFLIAVVGAIYIAKKEVE